MNSLCEKTSIHWKKKFAMNVTNKALVLRIYKALKINLETKNPMVTKMGYIHE